MREYGWPMQYSVFVSDLDGIELIQLRQRLDQEVNHAQDTVAVIDIGDPSERGKRCFTFIGVAPVLPTNGPLIL